MRNGAYPNNFFKSQFCKNYLIVLTKVYLKAICVHLIISTFRRLVYSTDRSKAVVPVLVLPFVALWILRGDLFYVLHCFFFFFLFFCFSVLLALRLPRPGKRELILVLFVRLLDLRLFGFGCFLFLLVSGKGCGL